MTGKVSTFYPSSAGSSALPGYLALCLALQALRLEAAQFRVIGPDQPVTASLGREAVLPCHLSPQMSAENMEVRWFRTQFSTVVHLYRDRQDQFGEQMPEYQGRTQILKGDITNGRVSLRIRDIRPSDDGQYKCFFQSSVSYEDALLELRVADLGSDPIISVEGHQDGGVRVVCRSSGWYPQPKPEWRDLQGQHLPSASEKTSQETNGLFQTEIAMVLTDVSNRKVSCRIRNPRLNQERESAISIAELFFPRPNPWKVALAVILPLLAVLLPLASYCFWRQRRKRERLKSEMKRRKEKYKDIKEKYKEAKELGLVRAREYAVDVTLDPDTAHPNLILSADWKCVRYGDMRQNLPDTSKRFDTYPEVLGIKKFTSGRHYWEVEVETGNETEWDLGVCRESVCRKGKSSNSPQNGYWTIRLWDGEYKASTMPRISLPVSIIPSRVGVFLDYEAGEVSFYNVTGRSDLFTFTDTFSGTLRPYFCIGFSARDTNKYPLRICPAPAQTGGNLSP